MGCTNAKAVTAQQPPRLLETQPVATPKEEFVTEQPLAVATDSLQDDAKDGPHSCHYAYRQHVRKRRECLANARATRATPAAETAANSTTSSFWGCCLNAEVKADRAYDYDIFPLLSPQKIAEHYGFPQGTGKGQNVAIIALDGKMDLEELKRDFHALHLTVPKNLRMVDVGDLSDEANGTDSMETHLDLEAIGGICPDANITIYRAANVGLQPFADAIIKAVEDGNSVISISWGLAEFPGVIQLSMSDAIEKAAKAGVTICVAAGDGGSSDNRDGAGAAAPASDGSARVDWPSASPFVLACGGTELMSSGEEHVWNNSAEGGGSTGGGLSRYVPAPTWQADITIAPAAGQRTGMRAVPDVAGLAAGGDWLVALDGVPSGVGGTSAVAPMWAALVVLANEQRAKIGKGPVGFFNEALYARAKASQADFFVDVVKGHNRPRPDYPGYDARAGFDACTGWGVPRGAEICKFLVELP